MSIETGTCLFDEQVNASIGEGEFPNVLFAGFSLQCCRQRGCQCARVLRQAQYARPVVAGAGGQDGQHGQGSGARDYYRIQPIQHFVDGTVAAHRQEMPEAFFPARSGQPCCFAGGLRLANLKGNVGRFEVRCQPRPCLMRAALSGLRVQHHQPCGALAHR